MEKHNEEKEEDKKHKGTYLRREFSYTQFQQSLLLPDNVEREKISRESGAWSDEYRHSEEEGDGDRFGCPPDRDQIIGRYPVSESPQTRGLSFLLERCFCGFCGRKERASGTASGERRIFESGSGFSGA